MEKRRQHAVNVYESKRAAKQDLTEMLWTILGATLLFFLPYFLIAAAFWLACCGWSTTVLPTLTYQQLTWYLGLYFGAQLLIVQPLYYGLTQFYAFRRAGGYPEAGMVTMCLCSWRLYLKSIRMALVIFVYSIVWLIPFGGICFAGYIAMTSYFANSLGWFLFIELVIISGAWYLSILLQYHCGYAVLMEHPRLGCWKAVRTAFKAFRGHRGESFSLLLSFVFWITMTVVFSGMLIIVVLPYFLMAWYHLFDRVRGVKLRVAVKKPEP